MIDMLTLMQGMHRTRTPGGAALAAPLAFTLVELIIVVVIIGLLAAMAVPRLVGASENAERAQITGDLATFRGAIDLYTVEHRGRSPAHDATGSINGDESFFRQRMLAPTDEQGNPLATGAFGGYLDHIPLNPYTTCPQIQIGNWTDNTDCAWRFDPATGQLRPDHTDAQLEPW